MAMVASRLFHRARQLYAPKALMPSLPIPKCTNYAYSATKSKTMGGTKSILGKECVIFNEEVWDNRRSEAVEIAIENGSPFCYSVLEDLEDLVSTDNAFSNSEGKELNEYLRNCKDIKFNTEIDSILGDKRLEEFQSSMTAYEIEKCVVNHLYVLSLQEVVPSEKLYMEYLINIFHNFTVESRWFLSRPTTLPESFARVFNNLPHPCLIRGFELHVSRIPYKQSLRRNFTKAFKKEMTRELEKDYKLLTTRIHDLPFIMLRRMMANEISSLVDHRSNGGYSSFSY